MLNDWIGKRNSPETEKLVQRGIPSKFRGEVWSRLSGNPFSITREQFDRGLCTSEKLRSSPAPLSEKASLFPLIQLDIRRTYNQLGYFREESPLYSSLQELLEVFTVLSPELLEVSTVLSPELNYIQGMSYLGGILILNLDVLRAFIIFTNIVTSPVLFPFYKVSTSGISSRFQLFRLVFKENLSELCDHFENEGVQPQFYLYEWFATLFSRALPEEAVGRVWDLYFFYGPVVLYKAAVGLLALLKGKLLAESFTGIMVFLSHVGESITNEDELIAKILGVSVSAWIREEISNIEIGA